MRPQTAMPQPGILREVPPSGRYLSFDLEAVAAGAPWPLARRAAWLEALRALSGLVQDGDAVVALGPDLVQALGGRVPGLREFPRLQAPVPIPATPLGLWCWLRGEEPGALVHRTRPLLQALAGLARCQSVVDAFRYGRGPHGFGRDLSGYEDGIENPQGDAALAAACVAGAGPGLDGGSFVALQQWRHRWDRLDAMSQAACDQAVGRRRDDSAELDDAPASAHVKRTAQEDFDPPAFVLRRSMPWAAGPEAGLLFVAFGARLDAFEAQLRRMAGLDDGVVDSLFGLSQPLTGSYAWCPPMHAGMLDLRALAD